MVFKILNYKYMSNTENYENVYLCGFGRVSVQTGRQIITTQDSDESFKVPFINIGYFNDKIDRPIGDVNEPEIEVVKVSKLVFKSVESLEVLQRSIDFCRKELESNGNVLP